MYNNPLMYSYPYLGSNIAKPAIARGLFSSIKGINWGGILSNTQKTLGIINQTIPIVYQVKPIINNAKTMFKIANTIKDNNKNVSNNNKENIQTETSNINANTYYDENRPVFFI